MILISIITINFNNAKGLRKTIDSVASQTFQDFEYIVIDGASKDESVEVIQQSPRINCWVSERDKGIYDAMNKGIQKAKGKYCLFLNSGDYLFSSISLSTIAPHLKSGADIVYGNMKIEDVNGSVTDGYMPDLINFDQMMRDTLWHPVSFIRRELFSEYGLYDLKYSIVADYKWFLFAIIKKRVVLKHINSFVSVFELGGVSNISENQRKLKAQRRQAQLEVLGKKSVLLFEYKSFVLRYVYRIKRFLGV